jgi:hypothetical protein
MTPSDRTDMIQNTLSIVPAPDGLYILIAVYPESDALNASGQVLHHRMDEEALTRCVLNTASPLAAMWSSPSPALWVGGGDGTVWTTAAVDWAPVPGLLFEILDPGLPWKITRLPNLSREGYKPNLTAIWGTSDTDVFCSTASGAIYHWNGVAWTESPSGFETGMNGLHGTGPADVYCVGYGGAVSHYNGQAWQPVAVTGIMPRTTIVTGVRALAPHQVYLVTNRGSLLTGDSKGFSPLATAEAKFMGLANFRGRLFLCSSPGGAWELVGNQIVQVKSNFSATDVYEVADRLYFIETEQPQGPSAVVYAPHRQGSPWKRIVF